MSTDKLRIGVAGASGRMGRLVVEEARAAGSVVAGGICHPGEEEAVPAGVAIAPHIAALAEACDVVIDFTHARAVTGHATALAAARRAWVLGTTGLGAAEREAVAACAHKVPVVWAANFSPGVALMLELARRLASALPAAGYDAEILEMHHRQKVDAPSGTALALGRAVAEARGQVLEKVAESSRQGESGPRRPGAIGFAVLRGGQIPGEHTLSFTSASEQISMSHRALDRRIFATGAIRAAFWVRGREPGLYGMEDVLGTL